MIDLRSDKGRAHTLKLCRTPDLGSVPMHNVIPRLSATPGARRRPAPALGEHTAEILEELGRLP